MFLKRTDTHKKIIAHRGASAEQPENSLKAFRRAIDLGVDYIETDIHHTLEGTPICIHEPSLALAGIKNIPAPLSNMPYSEIKAECFGHELIPKLEDLLSLSLGASGLMLELKIGYNNIDTFIQTIALEYSFLCDMY